MVWMENFINKRIDPKLPQDQQKKLRSRYATMIVCGIVVVSAVIVLLIGNAISGSAIDSRVSEVMATMDKTSKTASEELEEANKALESVTSELDAAKALITSLTERLDAADEAVKASDERLTAAETAITDAKSTLAEETDKLEKQQQEAIEGLEQGTSTQISNAIDALKTDLESTVARVDALETTVGENGEALAAAQKDVTYLLNTMKSVAKAALNNMTGLDVAQKTLDKATAAVDMDKEAIALAQADIEALKNEQSEAKAAQDAVNASLQERIDDSVQESITAINEYIESNEEILTAMRSDVNYLLDTMKIVAKAALNNGNRIDKSEPKNSTMEADIAAIKEELSAASEAILTNDNAVSAYMTETDEKIATLGEKLDTTSAAAEERFLSVEALIENLTTVVNGRITLQDEKNFSFQKSIDNADNNITALTEKQARDGIRVDALEDFQKTANSRLTVMTDNLNEIDLRQADNNVIIEDVKAKQFDLTNRQAQTSADLKDLIESTTQNFAALEQITSNTQAELEADKEKLASYIAEEDEKVRGISARVQVNETALKGMENHEERLKSAEASVRRMDGLLKNGTVSPENRVIPSYNQSYSSPIETLAELKSFLYYNADVSVNEVEMVTFSPDYELFETPDAEDLFGNKYASSLVPFSFGESAEYFEANDWGQYEVNGSAVSISGIVYVPVEMSDSDTPCKLFIYGDDQQLFESEPMTKDSEPQAFCIDLSGVDVVEICYENPTNFLIADFCFQVR